MGEVCEAIHYHLAGYQVNEDDFNAMDSNGDGQLSTNEVIDALNAMAFATGRDFYFSNNGKIFSAT